MTVGILNVHKPIGWTSHDVVARVRRLAAERRVGHAGTLDPLAEGVLPVLLGRATRLADFIQAGRKTYRASIALGAATSTDDAEGEIVERAPIPALLELERALAKFRGPLLQTPPAYSAIRVAGQRAYALARAGGAVALAPRPVIVDDIRVLSSEPLVVEVTCSKGTYIRSLARDLARELGTVGHLAGLVRTRVGPFTLEDAVSLDGLDVCESLLPPDRALPDAPIFRLPAEDTARLLRGQPVEVAGALHVDPARVYDPEGRMVCVGYAHQGRLYPRILL